MLAYSDFPDYCCRCVRPRPDGTCRVVQSWTVFSPNGDNPETRTFTFDVPLCRACQWARRLRTLLAFGLSGVIGIVSMVVTGVVVIAAGMEKAGLLVLAAGPLGATVALVCLWRAFQLSTVPYIARISTDGSEIRFWNDEYQLIYMGALRPGSRRQRHQDELPWR